MLNSLLQKAPVIAILRGVTPDEVEEIATVLIESGVRIIEVPMNSPAPLDSIATLRKRLEGTGYCVAGTVLKPGHIGGSGSAPSAWHASVLEFLELHMLEEYAARS